MNHSRSLTTVGPVTLEDLNERQAAFVEEYVERSGRPGDAPDAAQAAGYARNNRAAARVRASELLRNPKVLAVLRDELTRKLSAAAVLGVGVLIDLAETGPPQVRLSAAKELVDRGYGPVISRNAHVYAVTTMEDLLDQLDEADDVSELSRDDLEK